jgi:RimJ/RimL family protein N-acetyltransferase
MTNPLLIDVPDHLTTQRLTIRPYRRGDGQEFLSAVAESAADLRAFLWFLPWVSEDHTPASAEARCRTCEANFLARSDLSYLMFERSSRRLIGSVGLHRTDWATPKTEVGYWVRASAAGNGYAAEGVRTLVDWALIGLGVQRVELVTDEQNLASRKVAQRCSFTLEGTLRNVQRAPDGSLRNSCIYARLPAVSA